MVRETSTLTRPLIHHGSWLTAVWTNAEDGQRRRPMEMQQKRAEVRLRARGTAAGPSSSDTAVNQTNGKKSTRHINTCIRFYQVSLADVSSLRVVYLQCVYLMYGGLLSPCGHGTVSNVATRGTVCCVPASQPETKPPALCDRAARWGGHTSDMSELNNNNNNVI